MPTDLLGDLNPLWCYAIVLLAGALSAYWEVSDRFKPYPDAWKLAGTWLLMLAFTALPALLFFVLDRTGAIHDTSVFAALLIGFGYQQVLSGQIASAKAPSEVSILWQPFVKWVDWMNGRIRQRVARDDNRLREKLIADVLSSKDKYQLLLNLIVQHVPNPKDVQEKLKAEEESVKDLQDPIDKASAIRFRQAARLYEALLGIDDYRYLLKRADLLVPSDLNSPGTRLPSFTSFFLFCLFLLFLIALLPVGASTKAWMYGQYRADLIDFYVWRVARTNSSEADKYRTNEQLVAYLANPQTASYACQDLAAVLRYESLSPKDADRVLATLLANDPPGGACNPLLHQLLFEALRAPNSDVRARIQDSLIWLYSEESPKEKLPDSLKNWKPKPSESPADIEQNISLWRTTWAIPKFTPSATPTPNPPAKP